MTIAQATPVALADGGLSSSVAVAAAALVVVLTIVLVFVMVLRSSGGRRSGAGLGYDSQMGPLGQPQNAMDDHDWRAPGGAGGDRGWGQDFAGNGQAGGAWGGQQGGPWGGQQGSMAGAGTMPQGGAWGASADQGGWNAQSRGASPSRPMAPGAQGDWGSQNEWGAPGDWAAQGASAGAPAPTPSRPDFGAPGQAGSPWEQGAAAPPSGPGWRPAQPTMPAPSPAQQGGGGWGGQQMNGGWGGPAAAANQPGGGWDGGMPAAGAWGGAPAAQRLGVLVVRQGKEQGKTFELRKDRMTVGRSRESDIFLEDLAVSRLHTTILQDGAGRYLLRDEGSANGTYVNQQRVSEQILEDGDEIQVGQTILVFGWR